MSDQPTRPDLLVPDHRVVSIEEARSAPRKTGKPNDLVSRGDFEKWTAELVSGLNEQLKAAIAKGVVAMSGKAYEQWSGESAAFLEAMERDIEARILARLENERRARSLRGRVRALLARWRKPTVPTLVAPLSTEPVVQWVDAAGEPLVEEQEATDG